MPQTHHITQLLLSLCCGLMACQPSEAPTRFKALAPAHTQIHFQNQLEYNEEFNVYTYRNFYNGAGVGIGDLNRDGLPDVYFCGNIVDNKLYLNEGNFQFKDITESAGVACPDVWSSGVSLADVNGDGWLDIYVCKSGSPGGENRHNELFINNQDLTFTEASAQWGIDDEGLSTHAAFFDYDRDGDLDCYLLNNSIRPIGGYDLRPGQREERDSLGGNKLYRNDGDHFTDVSEEAGIYGSMIGFGLGVTIGDVDRDGWLDIYVSNDFFERDYLYLNQQDGTFIESAEAHLGEMSLGSMGADIGDINNDGYPEIFVTDMLPEDDARMKTKTMFDSWDTYELYRNSGYFHQFTRNVLQLNNGPAPYPDQRSRISFSEIGRLANVYATDWSWGALIFDMDNDGYKDIFVANGIYKDLTDQDYITYMNPRRIRTILQKEQKVIKQLIDSIPSEALPNYAFANQKNLKFENMADQWGLAMPSHSNGSAYADLDNDGDQDLVVNNVNMPPFIYQNQSRQLQPDQHFISIELEGTANNSYALGAQVSLYTGNGLLYQELNPMRGFQSTVDHRLHFGLGQIQKIDSLKVIWPDGSISLQKDVPIDQFVQISQRESQSSLPSGSTVANKSLLKRLDHVKGIDFQHRENEFKDFNRDPMLFHMLSTEGPHTAVGDMNGDGWNDLFIGGAKGQAGAVYIQKPNGSFSLQSNPVFQQDSISEDTDALLFDVDGDKDLDLYVCSGGNEFPMSSSALRDRLYLNNGQGYFSRADAGQFSAPFESNSCVRAADYDADGDMDLFVGQRLRPFLYGVPVSGRILNNDGQGKFTDQSRQIAPGLKELGLIRDAAWLDYDGDKDLDLIVLGEWMPLCLFENNAGTFIRKTDSTGFEQSDGFWARIQVADLDQDGDLDLIAGNHGTNSRFKASADRPVCMYVNDFDGNGTAEQFICVYNGEKSYPLVLRHDLVKQLPELKQKYLKYADYKNQTMEDMFPPEILNKSIKWFAYRMESTVFWNLGNGRFEAASLPQEAQLSPVFAILPQDLNQDGRLDLILGGNFYRAKPEVGIHDASYGLVLIQQADKTFSPLTALESGFFVKGEIRDLDNIWIVGKKYLLVSRNNDGLKLFEY